jgi:copper transport protein
VERFPVIGRAVVLSFVLFLAACWGWSAPVRAHAFLLETQPQDGAVLTASPSEARLTFNEPVAVSAADVVTLDGNLVISPAAWVVDGATLRAAFPPGRGDGVYLIRYRVVGADGHAVAGSIAFGVGVAPPSDPATDAFAAPAAVAVAAVAARGVFYAAVAFTVGGGLFVVLVTGTAHPLVVGRRRRRTVAAAVMPAAVALWVGVNGLTLTGGGFADLLTLQPWSAGWTTAAPVAASAVIAAAAAGPGFFFASAPLLLIGAAGGAVALALSGHIAGLPQGTAGVAVGILHCLAAAFWLGSLPPLSAALAEKGGVYALPLLRRFSDIAVAAVAVLIMAGLGLSMALNVTLQVFLHTAYGAVWAGKIILVGLLLVLAAWNRGVGVPQLAAGKVGAAQRLRFSIRLEIGLAALILFLTAGFSLTPRPPERSSRLVETAGQEPAYIAAAVKNGVTALLEVTPARVGLNKIMLSLTGANGLPVNASGIVLGWGEDGADIVLRQETAGRFSGEATVAAPGRISARVQTSVSGIETEFAFAVSIGEDEKNQQEIRK